MGAQKSKVLIELKEEDVTYLIEKTHFNEKEVRAMYKRYWAYCSMDGTVNKEQFSSMFSAASDKGKSIVEHIFRTTDRDDNMALDFTEFLTTVSVILRGTEVQKMMWVFHMFDENDDGTIEIEEIERILAGCDTKMNSTEIAKLFEEMDKDQDGKIDINEFTAGCRKNNLLLKNVGMY